MAELFQFVSAARPPTARCIPHSLFLSYRTVISLYDPREDLFDMLDVDGKGEISQVEFADGLLNLLTQLE